MTGALPLGEPLEWEPAHPPAARAPLVGAHVLLRPLVANADAEPLYTASHAPEGDPEIWTYLPDGPYESAEHMRTALAWAESSEDPLYFALVPAWGERAQGLAAYLRITPEFGVIELGHIWFAPSLRRTTAASEAIYLLMRNAFELGYRRVEWKCNALNAASRRAALRFGFGFEGVFRQHMVVKGRNRDTAWFAIVDRDWPAVDAGFQEWLSASNLDERGHQRRALGELIAASVAAA